MSHQSNDDPDGLDKFRKPIPFHPDWTDADYASEIIERTAQILNHYDIDLGNLKSQDDMIEALCRVLFDWVRGLRADHMPKLTAAVRGGVIFGEGTDPARPGVAQPVSERLGKALDHYRNMDTRKNRREELERFVKRSVSAGLAPSTRTRERGSTRKP